MTTAISCPPRLLSRPLCAMSASLGSFTGLRRCRGAPPACLSSARAPRSSARRAMSPFAGKKSDSEKPVLRPVPRAPDGTPTDVAQDLVLRPRRNRRSPTIRSAFREVCACAHHSGESTTGDLTRFLLAGRLSSLPPTFCCRSSCTTARRTSPSAPCRAAAGWAGASLVGDLCVNLRTLYLCLRRKTGLLREVREARAVGVNSVVIFPKTPDHLKSPTGEEAFNANGLAQRSISLLKDTFPDLEVYTDVALDPYNTMGHDGIVRSDGVVMNDETVHYLCKQALSQARAGADCIAPSDMMDGRVGALRAALDSEGFEHVSIMSYTAKYASAFYGPFREALASAPAPGSAAWKIPKDKATYQMDPSNYREALREAALDEMEGADIMMVKPAGAYLDIIRALRDSSTLPIAAYQVSGEYAMIKAAAERGWLDERAAVMESLLSIKRAGADVILTYFATQAAKWLVE